jgi:hypothetical protein
VVNGVSAGPDEREAVVARIDVQEIGADWIASEPPRVCRRLFGLSYTAMAGSSSMA